MDHLSGSMCFFTPCSQAVCSVHLAAPTVAVEGKEGKKTANPVPHRSARRKRSFLHRLPLIHLYLSKNPPLIFNLTPFSLVIAPSSTRLQSGAGARRGSAWCEAAQSEAAHENVTHCPHMSDRRRRRHYEIRDKRNTHTWPLEGIPNGETYCEVFFFQFIRVESDSVLQLLSARGDFRSQRLTSVRDELLLTAESIGFFLPGIFS